MNVLDRTGPLVCLAHRPDLSGPVPGSSYTWLTGQVDAPLPVAESRIQAVDLRDAQLQSNRLRVGRTALAGPLFLDIDVVVGTSAAAARRTLSDLAIPRRPRTLYIGTVNGLLGLIRDVHALGIADGVVLFPLSPDDCSEMKLRASLIA